MPIDSIFVVSPSDYPHSKCFIPFAEVLRDALQALGHRVEITTQFDWNKKAIVLGAHLLTGTHLPANWILYNTEQVGAGFGSTLGYINLLRRHEVWDYSPLNIKVLRDLNIDAKYCPLGYMPVLSRIPPCLQDVDILFYGSMNERRAKIINELREFNIQCEFGIYGAALEELIARSKIILNLHYHETAIFEIFRCSFLMANKKCVVSEVGNDLALEEPYYGAVAFAPYDGLAKKCRELLEDEGTRKMQEEAGFKKFVEIRQTEYLKAVL